MPDGRPPRAERRKGIKKTIACLLLVCALLGGCARSDGDVSVCAALARPFIMSAAYEIGEVSGTLVFEHRALGSGVLKFCEPQTLSGLTMTLADGYVTIERGEISRSYAAGDDTDGAAHRSFQDAVLNPIMARLAAVAYRIREDGRIVGGLVLTIDEDTQHNHLDLLFVDPDAHSKGIGYAAWQAVERLYPETKVWETCTPCFETRNIHFYVN